MTRCRLEIIKFTQRTCWLIEAGSRHDAYQYGMTWLNGSTKWKRFSDASPILNIAFCCRYAHTDVLRLRRYEKLLS